MTNKTFILTQISTQKFQVMKKFLFLAFLALTMMSFSQVQYQKGYLIDTKGNKINCWIKNMDWRNSPDYIEYKLNQNSKPEKGTLQTIKEFSIGRNVKYLNRNVKVYKTDLRINFLDYQREPLFKDKNIFLKLLVSGKANLYRYSQNGSDYFYYQMGDEGTIKPLVYKKYLLKISDGEEVVKENKDYRKEIFKHLRCRHIDADVIQNLTYKMTPLVNYFVQYNKCENTPYTVYKNEDKSKIYLTAFVQYNLTSLDIWNSMSPQLNTKFGQINHFGLGAEFEYNLAFNHNKWSIISGLSYTTFKKQVTHPISSVSGGELTTNLTYRMFEMPLGVRYYMYLNKNSKFFLGTAYNIYFDQGSDLKFTRKDGSVYGPDLNLKSTWVFSIDAGYKFKNKYSINVKFYQKRSILYYTYWKSPLHNIAINLGYTFL